MRRCEGISAHTDGREEGGSRLKSFAAQAGPLRVREEEWRDYGSNRWAGKRWLSVESFTAQTGPILHKFQGPARLRHHFVPVFLQGILSNSTKKVSKSISFSVFFKMRFIVFVCDILFYFI